MKQAEEIFAKGDFTTTATELSHPEAFIRARSRSLWQEKREQAETAISAMIEGRGGLEELDVPGQRRLAEHTRLVLETFLQPRWFQTPAVMGTRKLFFDDFQPAREKDGTALSRVPLSDPKVREYLCYVLLDFVTVDPELDEVPLAAALDLCGRMELTGPFEKLATKELKLKARELKRIKEKATEMLAKAEANGEWKCLQPLFCNSWTMKGDAQGGFETR